MPVLLTLANPLPQWELFGADDMVSKGIQKSEFLAGLATQNNKINLVGPSVDLLNPDSSDLLSGGINSPFLFAGKGFRVYNDPNDQRPVLEIDPSPTKTPRPNTPVGLCANTNLIGLCCDDHQDTNQALRVTCQPCRHYLHPEPS